MRLLRHNIRRPQLEQLEDRCIPGSVLDLLANPLFVSLGGGLSLDLLQIAGSAGALLDGQTTAAAQSAGSLVPLAAIPRSVQNPGDTRIWPQFITYRQDAPRMLGAGQAAH